MIEYKIVQWVWGNRMCIECPSGKWVINPGSWRGSNLIEWWQPQDDWSENNDFTNALDVNQSNIDIMTEDELDILMAKYGWMFVSPLSWKRNHNRGCLYCYTPNPFKGG